VVLSLWINSICVRMYVLGYAFLFAADSVKVSVGADPAALPLVVCTGDSLAKTYAHTP